MLDRNEAHSQGVMAWRILLTLILSIMGFLGNAYLSSISADLKELKDSSEKVDVHFAHSDERMAAMQAAISDTYRADDARRDQNETNAKLADLNRRVEALEKAVGVTRVIKGKLRWGIDEQN